MNSAKRTMTIAMAVMLAVFAGLSHAETAMVNGIQWTYEVAAGEASVGDGTQTAIPTSTRGDVTIPRTLGGCKVVEIMDGAFKECAYIRSVSIPDGVTRIGKGAFKGCSSLKSVSIPKGISVIEKEVFNRCENLTSIVLPEGVTEIGEYSFFGCISLNSIVLPKTLLRIGRGAFVNCKNLAELKIPESVIKMEASMLEWSGIRSFTFPPGISKIDGKFFKCCKNLEKVTIPNNVTIIHGYAFEGCSLRSITIPDGITKIGDGVFLNCSDLRSIIIPESVTEIGFQTFKGCSCLRSLLLPERFKGKTYDMMIPSGCKVVFGDTHGNGGVGNGASAAITVAPPPPVAPPPAPRVIAAPPVADNHDADAADAANAEADPFEKTEKDVATTPPPPVAYKLLELDPMPVADAYRELDIHSYKCRALLNDFTLAVTNANKEAASKRIRLRRTVKDNLQQLFEKATAAGNLDMALAFKTALDTADGEIKGDAVAVERAREYRDNQNAAIDNALKTAGIKAAKALYSSIDLQKQETTKKGDLDTARKLANFQQKVQNWARDVNGVAAKTGANAQPCQPVARRPVAQPSQPATPVREVKMIEPVAKTYTIHAHDSKGTMIGQVKAGDVIVCQYVDGKWAKRQDFEHVCPDKNPGWSTSVALVKWGDSNCIVKELPTGTKDAPFEYNVEEDDAGKIALRRMRMDDREKGVGSVRYSVKIIPAGAKR